MAHTHFFSYEKDASTETKYVSVCRTCGEVKVTQIPLVVKPPTLPTIDLKEELDKWPTRKSPRFPLFYD